MKTIYSTIVGSRLYGIDNPDSDTDIKGFGFPEPSAIIGLDKYEQKSEKTEDTESCIYTVQKFLHLCHKGNPTVLEVAFAKPKFHIVSTQIGLEVCKFVQENLLTKDLFKPYSAYFREQVRKLDRPNREGKRQPLIDKYGFDVKFAAHAYRLGSQCCEVMEYGDLWPTLGIQDQKMCKDIRSGVYSKERVKEYLVALDKEMYLCYKDSKLPDKPDYQKLNKFLTDIHLKYLNGEYDGQIHQVNTTSSRPAV